MWKISTVLYPVIYSNTTLVKVKCVATPAPTKEETNSNTTLVKVKSQAYSANTKEIT